MKKLALVAACSVLGGLLVFAAYQPSASALSGAVRVGVPSPSLLVEVDDKKKNNLFGLKKRFDEEMKKQKDGSGSKSKSSKNKGGDDDEPKALKKSKDKDKKDKDQAAKTCGKKVKCDAGYVRLEKPNKYGACCELPGGATPAKTTEKCKFPGEVGTPPNCKCPEGTEFLGYKGCVTVKYDCHTDNVVKKDGGYLGQGYTYVLYASNENEARAKFFQSVDDKGWKVNAPVSCKKVFVQ